MADFVPASEARRIVVASYNIHSCIGRDGRQNPMRIQQVLDDIDADIYGLQEVDARPRQANRVDQFEFFSEQTGMHAIAGPNIIENGARYGNVLLSRWPIIDNRLIDLSVEGYEPRGAISALVSYGSRRVRIVNTHLGLRRRERQRQIERLRDALSVESLPTIFLGDYNMWGRQQRVLRRLGAPTRRSAAPKTYSSRLPMLALDRIWTNSGAYLLEIETHRCGVSREASDHLPLKAIVRLTNEQTPEFRA